MSNRFDLEQEIMACWAVVDDLGNTDIDRGILHKYYEAKFEALFSTFESCIRNKGLQPLDKVTRVEVIDDDGRSYVNRNARNAVEASLQDNDETLKIFVNKKTHV